MKYLVVLLLISSSAFSQEQKQESKFTRARRAFFGGMAQSFKANAESIPDGKIDRPVNCFTTKNGDSYVTSCY